jgi:very-short-patch-repair endonuclease
MKYDSLSDNEKRKLIEKHYGKEQLSFAEIASMYSTYSNKIRRDATKLGIKIRTKSEAQKIALTSGRHKHPTKGEKRSDEVKQKIGRGIMESWENLTEQELNTRKAKARENWDKLSDDEKENLVHKANLAVRKSSDEGTKLEKFLLAKLLAVGYRTEFHKEQFLSNTKLQIDLFLPSINVAIEIDGPSHFSPIWGEDALSKNIKYDNKKNGLILGRGMVLIRIKQTKDYSPSRAEIIASQLLNELKKIQDSFPGPKDRLIEIGD